MSALKTSLRARWTKLRVDLLASRVTRQWAARLDDHDVDAIVLGRYELDRVLGRGSHGVVIAGFDRVLERDVALKLFRTATARTVVDEARILARLRHPNIVTVHDLGLYRGLVFLVTALIDGWTLAERARMDLDRRELVELFVQAGHGLAAAHSTGIVHGDFKPANVLVGRDGQACIADFGMARIVGLGERDTATPTGTRPYLAPECWAGADVDERGDQFAFCVALWEALHGGRPWPTSAPLLHRDIEPAKPKPAVDIPAALEALIRRGLAPRPDDRHPSMDALIAELGPFTALGHPPCRRAS